MAQKSIILFLRHSVFIEKMQLKMQLSQKIYN